MFIVNRNSSRADALVDKLGLPKHVHSRYYEDLRSLGEFDMIINATSAARSGGATTLRASYGEGFKAPSLYQLYGDYGNDDLQPETSKGWDAGITQQFLDGAAELSATWFTAIRRI